MNTMVASVLAVVLAYLIGAIPFAYLVVKAIKGIDIRTVGSGNVGATNVGRVLGFRFFLLVFLLDVLKGLLPTWGIPWLVRSASGVVPPDLPVLVALSAILGHNFPIYLKFRGGKGVATSLGALLALDLIASLAAATSFGVILLITRIVSISSLIGGLVFVGVHFVRDPEPWSRNHVAMSVVTLLLLGMLIVRHRTNLARIWAGTEPKVTFGKKPPSQGRIVLPLILGLLLLAAVGFAITKALQPATMRSNRIALAVAARVGTGHQRADRVAFLDSGRRLAVSCPRYDRMVIYQVTDSEPPSLEPFRDVKLDGKPVALCATADRLYVLQRPSGDARHLEPGFWRSYDISGNPIGERFPVGYDPDDMVLTPDGRTALVLLSGNAEGETNRPDPELLAIEVGRNGAPPRVVSRFAFDQKGDDPDRLVLSEDASHAAVVVRGTNQVVGFELGDPLHPSLTGRVPIANGDTPYVSQTAGDAILMPVLSRQVEAVAIPSDAEAATPPRNDRSHSQTGSGLLIVTRPEDSTLEVLEIQPRRSLGRLPLRGPANIGGVIPTGIAYSRERELLAVANRSGGVHLVKVERPRPVSNRIATKGRQGAVR